MPRVPRKYMETSFFHIVVQGINKSYIFNTSEEIKKYIKCIFQVKDECEIEIIAYCIMNNHAHILIKTINSIRMSQYMHKVNTKYAIYYNKKHNRVGYVFRNRYKAQGIYSEKQLQNCIKYIHDNPVKAGIVEKSIDYKYSNCKIESKYIINKYEFIDVDEDKEKICKEIVSEYLKNVNIEDFIKEKYKLKELIKVLNIDYKVSLRKIEKVIGISRETIRKLLN